MNLDELRRIDLFDGLSDEELSAWGRETLEGAGLKVVQFVRYRVGEIS